MTWPATLPDTFLDALPAEQRGEAEAVAQAWMGFLPGLERALPAAQACPDDPALALLAGLVALLGQTPAAAAEAARHLQVARRRADRLDGWGQGLLQLAELWLTGELGLALRAAEQLAAAHPEAPLTLKLAEWLCYLRGQAVHGARLLDLALWFGHHHPHHPDVLAIEAFAHELCGSLPAAERRALQALELRSLNPWADHALLHALQRGGALERALALAEQRSPSWGEAAAPMALHNHWHWALLWLEAADAPAALRQWQQALDAQPVEQGTGELIDRIALNCRLELAAAEPLLPPFDPEWSALAEAIGDRVLQPEAPLIAAHYGWCLARAGCSGPLAELRGRVEQLAHHPEAVEPAWCWQPAALAILDGAVALAQGRHAHALALLEPVQGWFSMAGGSDAQAQILDQMLLVAARGCGRHPLVEQRVGRLRADRPQLTPLDRHWLSRC